MAEKDYDGFILFIGITFITVIMFVAIITAVKKSFHTQKDSHLDSSQMLHDQRQRQREVGESYDRMMETQETRTDDLQRQQKQMMQDQQQRLRDIQRR